MVIEFTNTKEEQNTIEKAKEAFTTWSSIHPPSNLI